MNVSEMRERVRRARVARLATLDGDGRPNVVPFVFALMGDRLYSAVDRKPKRSRSLRRLENIRARPAVTVIVDHYEEDWSRLWWVRVRGTARVLEEGGERESALAQLREKYPQYAADPPDAAVIAISADDWHGWSSEEAQGEARSERHQSGPT